MQHDLDHVPNSTDKTRGIRAAVFRALIELPDFTCSLMFGVQGAAELVPALLASRLWVGHSSLHRPLPAGSRSSQNWFLQWKTQLCYIYCTTVSDTKIKYQLIIRFFVILFKFFPNFINEGLSPLPDAGFFWICIDCQNFRNNKFGSDSRKIRRIESNAKCRYPKKLTCKGTLRPLLCPHTPPPPLPTDVYTV